ncbi:VCBS repeat-containing protein [Microbacterium sp.]|uniref:FG-GAP repeat domain-containing protein n=1 Tax=Microbacterium sp. TaxID=51671 RepID=UPI002E37500D|nr:VCBS repeat-containing protein [Microbacterium sp.]HEX5728452.1 VCBS repeat-containing protein [Microbacterium sp.]
MSIRPTVTRTAVGGAAVLASTIAAIIILGRGGIDLATAWSMRVIATGSSGTGNLDGADGVDAADVDGANGPDIAVGYEQGLRLSLSFNPGPTTVWTGDWPRVVLPAAANLCSAEDVVIGELDNPADGQLDVVAACETGTVRVSAFFGPTPPNSLNELLEATNWTQADLTASAGNRSMRAAIVNIDGIAGNEIVVGGKESSGPCVAASLGYYVSATPRTGASWAFVPITPVGWVMQLYCQDLDGDTDIDCVFTDREPIDCPTPGGGNQGITVMKATTPGVFAAPVRYFGGEGDHKWFTLYDHDGDTDLDIVGCRSNGTGTNTAYILLNGGNFNSFPTTINVPMPSGVGQCQHVWAGDIDNDSTTDLVFSFSNAQNLSAYVWYKVGGTALSPTFARGEISGNLDADSDVKGDNTICFDADGDGDKDCFWTEQHMPNGTDPGLGLVAWENPLLTFVAPAAAPEVTCSLLTAGSQTSPDASSYNTASISPVGNRPLYAVVETATGAGPSQPTATGNGLTWVVERSVTFSTRRLTVLRALGASPSSGAVTYDFAGQTQTSAIWQVVQCAGADTSGTNGSGATPQSASATVAAGTTFTATLPGALNSSGSRLLCWVGLDIASTVSPDADLLEFSDANVAAGASTLEGQGALNQTACTPTFSSANGAGIVVEVRTP